MTLIQSIYQILIDHGIGADDAKNICAAIAKQHGGGRAYISKSDFARRNREIVDSFRGFNHSSLGDSFELSARQIRRIVDKK